MTSDSEAEQQIEDDAGVHWTVATSFRADFEATLRGRAAALARGEGSRFVKGNQVRSVVVVRAGERDVYLKRHWLTGWKNALRYAIFSTRGVNEWRQAKRLLAHGFDTAAPLAVGERRRGLRCLESFSVAEAIAPASPVFAVIESLPLVERRAFLVRIGETLKRLHDEGIHHRDLHGNNLLVAQGPGGEARLCFIDLHSVWSMPWVPRRSRQTAMAKLLGSMLSALSRSDRRRVLAAYLGSASRPTVRRWWRGIEAAIEKERRRRLFTRTRRCLRESTRFRQAMIEGQRLWHRREIEPGRVKSWVDRLDAGDVEWMKEGRRSRVGRFVGGPESGEIVAKEFLEGRWSRLARWLLGARSKAEAGWLAANGLKVRGIETPEALACVRVNRQRSILLTRFLPDAAPLDRVLAKGGPPGTRRALTEALARFTATLHRRGVLCPDLAAKNLLVLPGSKHPIVLADLDRLSFDDRRPSRLAELNLVQLNDLPPDSATRTERLRFLRAYLRHHPIGEWKRLFRSIDLQTRARIDRYRAKVLRIYGELPDDTYYPAAANGIRTGRR